MDIANEALLDIMLEAAHRFGSEMREEYKSGKLEEFLQKHGMMDLLRIEEDNLYESYPYGKVIIFGKSDIKENIIYGVLKECGLSKSRVELRLGYDDYKNYDFRHLQYNPNYRLVLFGPIPHSMVGKEDSSSVIGNLENTEGYPKVIRLMDSNRLKITKTSLKKAITEQIRSHYLQL